MHDADEHQRDARRAGASTPADARMTVRPRRAFTLLVIALAALGSARPCVARQDQPDATPAGHQHAPDAEPAALFPAREASGTSWQPDATPMAGLEWRAGGWTGMVHGNVFGQFLYEPGERHRTGGFASKQASSVNWGMIMARRPAGAGRVGLRAMLSAEPWTVSDCGYLNFLATGETCEGDTIHDRQHPHDLFMEIAADYDRPLRGAWRWQIYGGLAGEPALGPAAFPHRASAVANPVAPIAHHWLDSTHLAFGVVTAGLYDRRWKAELSVFNGREPDEDRAGLDLAALDSVSGRVSWLPAVAVAVQVSAARLRAAEFEFDAPAADVVRLTASTTVHRETADGAAWATTIAFGLNSEDVTLPDGVFPATTGAALVESSFTRSGGTWFGRAEVVGKPAHDLHAHEFGDRIFTVGKVQAGYERHLRRWKGLATGLGGTVSASLLPRELESRYSRRIAPGFGVFLSIRTARHAMTDDGHARSGAVPPSATKATVATTQSKDAAGTSWPERMPK